MKNTKFKYFLVFVALFVSLFIYLFYRTEKTVVNSLFIQLFSVENYSHLKTIIQQKFPLNNFVIYSLPEGLWVFSITLLSYDYFLKIREIKISLVYLPIVFSIGLEFFQLIGITNGKFDFWDIFSSFLFWFIGYYLMKNQTEKQNIFTPFSTKKLLCICSYLIVYFSHVSAC